MSKRPDIEARLIDEGQRVKHTTCQYKLLLSHVAQTALELIKLGSFHPCMQTGTCDKAGNAIYRLMTPDELITRSCDIARLAFDRFEIDGTAVENPTLDDVLQETHQVGFGSASSNGAKSPSV